MLIAAAGDLQLAFDLHGGADEAGQLGGQAQAQQPHVEVIAVGMGVTQRPAQAIGNIGGEIDLAGCQGQGSFGFALERNIALVDVKLGTGADIGSESHELRAMAHINIGTQLRWLAFEAVLPTLRPIEQHTVVFQFVQIEIRAGPFEDILKLQFYFRPLQGRQLLGQLSSGNPGVAVFVLAEDAAFGRTFVLAFQGDAVQFPAGLALTEIALFDVGIGF
ncbi:hypothetical protein D3C80_1040980 [compost metagenome]